MVTVHIQNVSYYPDFYSINQALKQFFFSWLNGFGYFGGGFGYYQDTIEKVGKAQLLLEPTKRTSKIKKIFTY
jgi:hypothetical protein